MVISELIYFPHLNVMSFRAENKFYKYLSSYVLHMIDTQVFEFAQDVIKAEMNFSKKFLLKPDIQGIFLGEPMSFLVIPYLNKW